MSTWIGVLVEAGGSPKFWETAKAFGVRPTASEAVPPRWTLISCDAVQRFEAAFELAKTLSVSLETRAVGFGVQTNADVHVIETYERGQKVRSLSFSRDEGGWVEVVGTPQPWESAYFFDGKAATADGHDWPDMLDDDLRDEDIAQYEVARSHADPSAIMQLLHPSSIAPMTRVCTYLSVDPNEPIGLLKPRSFLSRLLGKG